MRTDGLVRIVGADWRFNGSSLIFPWARLSPDFGAGIGTAARPLESRGCRGFNGPVPQPLWIKKSVFSCLADYIRAPTAQASSQYPRIHIDRYRCEGAAVRVCELRAPPRSIPR